MQPGHFLKSASYFSGPELNIQIKIWSQLFKRGVYIAIHRINHYSGGQVLGKPIVLSSG